MKYWIYENSKIPQMLSLFIDIWAITLYPFIICKGKMEQRTRTHEIIHLHQQRELLIIGFYFLYVVFWIAGGIKTGSFIEAYQRIPFEKEAYANDGNMVYPINRKAYSWLKYLKK